MLYKNQTRVVNDFKHNFDINSPYLVRDDLLINWIKIL